LSLDNVAAPAAGDGPALTEAPVSAPVSTPSPAPERESSMTPREAASLLARRRHERDQNSAAAPSAPQASPAYEPDDTAPARAPGESDVPERDDAAEMPPIEPPRSWTKEEKDRFSALPRELQAYLSEREAGRERDFLQRQQQIVEQQRAAQRAQQQYQQSQAQYEQALPHLLQTLYARQQGEFADIRTPEDVVNLARTDPVRYTQWDATQKQVALAQQQVHAAQQRQFMEQSQRWEQYVKAQDDKFAAVEPDFSDPVKAPKLQSQVRSYLTKKGLSENEIKNLWSSNGVFRDARTQAIIWDAARYEAAREAARSATAKPLPQVQRPGAAQTKSERSEAGLQALKQRFEQSGSDKDAVALLIARRKSAR
jgi:hypothetical protein